MGREYYSPEVKRFTVECARKGMTRDEALDALMERFGCRPCKTVIARWAAAAGAEFAVPSTVLMDVELLCAEGVLAPWQVADALVERGVPEAEAEHRAMLRWCGYSLSGTQNCEASERPVREPVYLADLWTHGRRRAA